MSSAAQINANRTNSESSTGPRTEAGKAKSSLNAFKHGLASGKLIIEGESREDFNAMKNDLRFEYHPNTTTEEFLIEKMAMSLWFARRAMVAQSVTLNNAPDDDFFPEKKLALMIRYQAVHDRAFYKALETLRKLQKERSQNKLVQNIGFVQKASAEELWDFAVEQHKKQYPGEPFPEFSPEEKAKLIESLR